MSAEGGYLPMGGGLHFLSWLGSGLGPHLPVCRALAGEGRLDQVRQWYQAGVKLWLCYSPGSPLALGLAREV